MKRMLASLLFALAACTGEDMLVPAPEVTTLERVASRFATLEVMEVSLPEYAAEAEIFVEGEGTLASSGLLWADDPSRAVTLALARNLTEITGARIAPEPWPFDAYPDARVDVRIERLLANADGELELAGQVFVADLTGRGRDRARLFSLSEPMGADPAPADAARARSAIVARLAVFIAENGLR